MIPDKTKASIKDGSWFIFNDGTNIIQIWSSSLSGKEKVFLNNELVSERRSMKMQNSHKFKDKKGQNYEVKFVVVNLLKGVFDCVINKDESMIKVFRTRLVKGKNLTFKRLLILVLASTIFGVLMMYFKLPDFTLFIFVIIVLIIHFKTKKSDEIIIEED